MWLASVLLCTPLANAVEMVPTETPAGTLMLPPGFEPDPTAWTQGSPDLGTKEGLQRVTEQIYTAQLTLQRLSNYAPSESSSCEVLGRALNGSAFGAGSTITGEVTEVPIDHGGCRFQGTVQFSDGAAMRFDLNSRARPPVDDAAEDFGGMGLGVMLMYTPELSPEAIPDFNALAYCQP